MKTVVLSAVVTTAAFGALAKDVLIDAQSACLSTDVMAGGRATFQLAPGSYTVSLVDNTMSCSGGNLDGACVIDTVIIRGGNSDTTAKPGWGMAVKADGSQKFKIKVKSQFSAFVVDEPCSDNTGSAVLRFEKVSTEPQ